MSTEDLLPLLFLSYSVVIAGSLIATEFITTRFFKRRLRNAIDQKSNRRQLVREAFQGSVVQAWMAIGITGMELIAMSVAVGGDAEARGLLIAVSIASTGIVAGLLLTGSMDSVKRKGVVKEFRRIMKTGDRQQFNDLALGVLDFGKLRFNILAVQAMERWGAPDVVPILKKLFDQTPPGFRFRPPGLKAMAEQALAKVSNAVGTIHWGDEKVWLLQAKSHLYYRRLIVAAASENSVELEGLLAGLKRDRYPVPLRQYALHRAFPDIICRDCRTRAEKVPHAYGSHVKCRVCRKSDRLETGVVQLVGRIGAGKDWERTGESLFVQLWDEGSKEPQFAEIDALAFGPLSGENSDWAIASVLETLRNEMPQDKVPIPLASDPPKQLSTNALHQLRIISKL